MTMLADRETVDAVMLDGGGLDAMAEDAVWLQMSTVGGPWTDRLAAAAADRGVGFLDAPVLGTKEPAESGDLLVLASGPEHLRERCEPVLDAVGRATMWVGAQVGVGSRLKVVVNSWLLGLVGALAEAVALARATDVPPEQFLEAIEGGPLGAPYARIKGTATRTWRPSTGPTAPARDDPAAPACRPEPQVASGAAATERPPSLPRASSSPRRSPGTGREKKYPCTCVQPIDFRVATCAAVSTPSTTVGMPRRWPSSSTVRATAAP